MRLWQVPLLRQVTEAGPDDSVFDALLLAGPLLILLIAVLGRSAATIALTAVYLAAFVGYVIYKGVRRRD